MEVIFLQKKFLKFVYVFTFDLNSNKSLFMEKKLFYFVILTQILLICSCQSDLETLSNRNESATNENVTLIGKINDGDTLERNTASREMEIYAGDSGYDQFVCVASGSIGVACSPTNGGTCPNQTGCIGVSRLGLDSILTDEEIKNLHLIDFSNNLKLKKHLYKIGLRNTPN